MADCVAFVNERLRSGVASRQPMDIDGGSHDNPKFELQHQVTEAVAANRIDRGTRADSQDHWVPEVRRRVPARGTSHDIRVVWCSDAGAIPGACGGRQLAASPGCCEGRSGVGGRRASQAVERCRSQ